MINLLNNVFVIYYHILNRHNYPSIYASIHPSIDLLPVERELVEPHGAHEVDHGQLVVEQLLPLHHPQPSQFLES